MDGGRGRRRDPPPGRAEPGGRSTPGPGGRRIAYVCDGTLRVIEADGTGDRVIAVADQPDVTFGVAEHTGYAGLGGLRGFWWAPDAARLLVARVDSAGTLVHVARGADRPADRSRRLPGRTAGARRSRDPARARAAGTAGGAVPAVLAPARRGRLPILADPYGGASLQRVTAELNWRCLVPQWLAEQGFAVLVADGSGTPGRGPAWEREVHGDVYGPVLQDQVTAVQEAARLHPDLDPGRVGIRAGRSAGRWRHGPYCTGPMSSTSRWPGRASPTSGYTTRTGGSGSSAIPTSSPSGTRPSR